VYGRLMCVTTRQGFPSGSVVACSQRYLYQWSRDRSGRWSAWYPGNYGGSIPVLFLISLHTGVARRSLAGLRDEHATCRKQLNRLPPYPTSTSTYSITPEPPAPLRSSRSMHPYPHHLLALLLGKPHIAPLVQLHLLLFLLLVSPGPLSPTSTRFLPDANNNFLDGLARRSRRWLKCLFPVRATATLSSPPSHMPTLRVPIPSYVFYPHFFPTPETLHNNTQPYISSTKTIFN
jgi:hypothetical protein